MAPSFPLLFLIMNEAIKQSWLKALRSGEYQQGHENLCNNGKFCCLGVLTDLYSQATNQHWRHDVGGLYSFENEGGVLPLSVQQWAELPDENPTVEGLPLSLHNDGGSSFKQIAAIIENNL